jgi:hypothetical protein
MSKLQVGDLVEYKTPNGNIYTGIISRVWPDEYSIKIRSKKIVDENNYVYAIRSTVIVRKNRLTRKGNLENRMMSQIRSFPHKKRMMTELKSLPPMPEDGAHIFPGGIDFQEMRNRLNELPRWNKLPRINNLERKEKMLGELRHKVKKTKSKSSKSKSTRKNI